MKSIYEVDQELLKAAARAFRIHDEVSDWKEPAWLMTALRDAFDIGRSSVRTQPQVVTIDTSAITAELEATKVEFERLLKAAVAPVLPREASSFERRQLVEIAKLINADTTDLSGIAGNVRLKIEVGENHRRECIAARGERDAAIAALEDTEQKLTLANEAHKQKDQYILDKVAIAAQAKEDEEKALANTDALTKELEDTRRARDAVTREAAALASALKTEEALVARMKEHAERLERERDDARKQAKELPEAQKLNDKLAADLQEAHRARRVAQAAADGLRERITTIAEMVSAAAEGKP